MASQLNLYNKFFQYIMDGTIDLDTNTLKVALVTSSYTPSAQHDVLADVLASPSPEVAAVASPSNGYTQGGVTVTGNAITFTDTPAQGKFDADDAEWTALTATFRYAILYASGTLNGVVDPLIAWILLDATPADIEVAGVDYSIIWSASGIFTLARA
jgi:hypothetical protein